MKGFAFPHKIDLMSTETPQKGRQAKLKDSFITLDQDLLKRAKFFW